MRYFIFDCVFAVAVIAMPQQRMMENSVVNASNAQTHM